MKELRKGVIFIICLLMIPIMSLFITSCKVVAQLPEGSVTLSWTSPGDDGSHGTASEYDMRYTSDLGLPWEQWTQADGEPTPEIAGTLQSMTVNNLPIATLFHFAIKTADEIPNWSPISNIFSITLIDITPPNMVDDLGGAQQGTE